VHPLADRRGHAERLGFLRRMTASRDGPAAACESFGDETSVRGDLSGGRFSRNPAVRRLLAKRSGAIARQARWCGPDLG
jgi:hypothetical protein